MGILYHRHVTLIDAFLTTVVLEFIGCTFAFSVNYFILRVIGVLDPIQNLGFVIEGWCAMGFLSLGVASAIAVLTEQYEVQKQTHPAHAISNPSNLRVFVYGGLAA